MTMSPRRAEILEIAADLFARRGYGETSMRDLGEATGLLPGSIYTHFRSKAAMLVEILDQYYDELEPALEAVTKAQGTGAAKLRSLIHATVHVTDSHRNALSVLHYDFPQIRATPEAARVVERSLASLSHWAEAIEQGQADGSLHSDVPAALALRVIPPTIHSLMDRNRLPERSDGIEGLALDDIVAALEGVVLRGLLAERETLPDLVGVGVGV